MRQFRIKPQASLTALSIFMLVVSFFSSCATSAELAPKITFLAPPGNIYSIGDLAVSVSVTNFFVVDKQGQPAVQGEGHLHYFLDVDAPIAQGSPAVTTSGTWYTTAATTYTWTNVGSGVHVVTVELVNNDHTPLDPPIVATMQVLVVPERGDPRAVILLPRDGGKVSAGDLTVSIESSNFLLVEPTEETPSPCEGHIVYFIDEEPSTNPGEPVTTDTSASTAETSYTWHDVTAGVHTFTIELVNDDDIPLTPAVVSRITVTVI